MGGDWHCSALTSGPSSHPRHLPSLLYLLLALHNTLWLWPAPLPSYNPNLFLPSPGTPPPYFSIPFTSIFSFFLLRPHGAKEPMLLDSAQLGFSPQCWLSGFPHCPMDEEVCRVSGSQLTVWVPASTLLCHLPSLDAHPTPYKWNRLFWAASQRLRHMLVPFWLGSWCRLATTGYSSSFHPILCSLFSKLPTLSCKPGKWPLRQTHKANHCPSVTPRNVGMPVLLTFLTWLF